MEDRFYVEPTQISPEIELLKDGSVFIIKGRSMPENSELFYQPVLNWIERQYSGSDVSIVLDVKLDYYNTGSFIRLMGLFNLLGKLNESGADFRIRWICDSDDEDNIADGESFKEVVKVPFDIVAI